MASKKTSGGALSITSSFDVSLFPSAAGNKSWEFENNAETTSKTSNSQHTTSHRPSTAPSVLDGLPVKNPEDLIIEDNSELGTKHVFCIYFSLILFFITGIVRKK
jgi:hypothetical protein